MNRKETERVEGGQRKESQNTVAHNNKIEEKRRLVDTREESRSLPTSSSPHLSSSLGLP